MRVREKREHSRTEVAVVESGVRVRGEKRENVLKKGAFLKMCSVMV